VAFVSKGGGAEQQNETAGIGDPIDFDPFDDAVVKVHYDVTVWNFDQQAELSEAMAEAFIPHGWDGTELVVPETHEERVDVIFERLEQELGPFPIVLEEDAESTEFNLDEWTDGDRKVLTESLIESEVPFRWEGATVVVAADAEDAVDDLLANVRGHLTASNSGQHLLDLLADGQLGVEGERHPFGLRPERGQHTAENQRCGLHVPRKRRLDDLSRNVRSIVTELACNLVAAAE
jgi:hypothetical protein